MLCKRLKGNLGFLLISYSLYNSLRPSTALMTRKWNISWKSLNYQYHRCYKIIYNAIKNDYVFSQIVFLMCLKQICKSLSFKKVKLKKRFFITFGHYLASACCEICLVLGRWVVHMVMNLFFLDLWKCNKHSPKFIQTPGTIRQKSKRSKWITFQEISCMFSTAFQWTRWISQGG